MVNETILNESTFNLSSPNSSKLYIRLYYRKHNGIAQFLLRARFRTLWRSEIDINLKIDADVLNRRRRRFCVSCTISHIYQGQVSQSAGKCACVYGVCVVKNKVENETNLTESTSNLT
jgi:hypothetical protein